MCGPALPTETITNKAVKYYITPQVQDWSRYDMINDKYVTMTADDLDFSAMSSMLELTEDEADSLSIIHMYVDYKQIRGGRASTTTMRKLFVVRAEWQKQPVVGSSIRAKAAKRWLVEHNR